jgi:2-polyprenyl-6-methoxyphenol hydroxylase-like FAD-dependent oxidoreductase
MTNRTVLISGIGIAGPTLAYWLARYGFEPTLIEHSPALRESGYVIDFWGVGYDVAERMDLIPDLRHVGYEIQQIQIVDRHGHRIGGFNTNLFRSVLGNGFFSILRGDLAKHIFAKIDGRVETIFGDSIQTIEQSESDVRSVFGGRRRAASI